jgi:hypothetical protein
LIWHRNAQRLQAPALCRTGRARREYQA